MTQRQSRSASQRQEKEEKILLLLEQFKRANPPRPGDWPWDVEALLVHIHTALFDHELNVNTAKRNCSIRNNNCSTHFRRALGIGVRSYIESLRLRAASQLLKRREFEVALISRAVGYDHVETFCRAFRRRFGCTPSGYAVAATDGRPHHTLGTIGTHATGPMPTGARS